MHIIRSSKSWSFESKPLARDKIQQICGSGHADDLGIDNIGQGADEGLGHRRLLTFLRGPPEQQLLGILIPRDKRAR